MYVLQCPHDVDVHLLFSFDFDLHITCFQGHVKLLFNLSILTDGDRFVLGPQKNYLYSILTNIMYVLQCPHGIHVPILF